VYREPQQQQDMKKQAKRSTMMSVTFSQWAVASATGRGQLLATADRLKAERRKVWKCWKRAIEVLTLMGMEGAQKNFFPGLL
jgi:hypothetical protein